MTGTLSRRALNRSLLARQLLLDSASRSGDEILPTPYRENAAMCSQDGGAAGAVMGAVEHLVGLQGQSPAAPYFGLRARLDGFDPHELSALIETRQVVRIALMRSTIHLVTARDCLRLRPVMQAAVERSLSNYRKQIAGVDRAALLGAASALFDEKPRTGIELERELGKRWKKRDPHALAMAVRCWLPLVQVPPRGLWGNSGAAAHTTVENWLGESPARSGTPKDVLTRYLRAFGPASTKDFQTWSGLAGAAEIVDRVRPQLRRFRDEGGVEIFDVPDALFPDPDTPVAPRFLPEYDNALLSHSDRSRIIATKYRNRIFTKGALLVDGFAIGRWWIVTRPKKIRDLVIEAFEPISKKNMTAVDEEAGRVLRFAAGDKAGDVLLPERD